LVEMMRAMLRVLLVSLFGAVMVATVGAGCGGAKYPSCDNDENCNEDGHKGVCLSGTCVACRDDASCGKGMQCRSGQCEAIADYCDDSHACSGTCKDHHCAKAVTQATHDPTSCDDEHPCTTPGERCQNGHCVAPPHGGPGCTDFPPPKYAYESPDLTDDAKKTIQRLAACLTTGSLKGAKVLLVGHCDARGEYEFNMGLGAERAEGAKKLLVSLGVPVEVINTTSRGKLDATGTDEAGWSNDRRVDVEIR
jgi:hypothetical protein